MGQKENFCMTCRHRIIESGPEAGFAEMYCKKHYWISHIGRDTFYKRCEEIRGRKKFCEEWEQGGIKGFFQRLFKKIQQMKPKESEKTLEARLVREIEARGGMALKYTPQFHRGIPDRIILLPGGVQIFVELKSTGKKPTKLQDHAMEKLEKLGFVTRIVDSTESLDSMLCLLDRVEQLRKEIHSRHLQNLPKTDKI